MTEFADPASREIATLRARITDLEQQLAQTTASLEQQTAHNQELTQALAAQSCQAESYLQSFLERVGVAIARIRVLADQTWTYELCSAGHESVFGYTSQELMNDPTLWGSRVIPEDLETVILPLFGAIFQEQAFSYEYRFRHKNGEVRWIAASFRSQRDGADQSWLVTGISQDITTLKQAEIAQRNSEARFQEIAHSINQVFFVRSLETGEFLYVSPAYETIWGRSCNSLYYDPQSWMEAIHPGDRAAVEASVDQQFAGLPTTREYRIVRPEGTIRWITAQIEIIRDPAGNPIHVVGVAADMSDRKAAELALEKSQRQLSLALQAAQLGHWHLDLTTGELNASNKCKAQFGLPLTAELTMQTVFESMAPDDRARVQAALDAAIAQHTDYKVEYRIIGGDGRVYWLLALGQPTYDATGTPLSVDGITLDITERKQLELALQKSEKQISSILGSISDAFISLDREWRFVYLNTLAEEILQCNREALLGRNLWEQYPGAVGSVFYHQYHWAMKHNQSICFEGYSTRVNSWFEVRVYPFGEGLSIYLRDISDRKLTESELRQQTERAHLIGAITRRIRQSLNLNYILTTTVNEVRHFLQTDRVVIYQMSQTDTGRVVQESVAPGWQVLLGQELVDPCFSSGYVDQYYQGRIRSINDIDSGEIEACHANFLRQLDVRANLVVPIVQGGNLWGLLIAHQCDGPRQWSPGDRDLLKQLAEQVSIAIQQATLYEQARTELTIRQQAESQLQRLNQDLEARVQQRTSQLIARTTELEALFEAIPDLVFIVSADGTFLDCKTPDSPYIYQPLEQVLGRSALDVLPDPLGTQVTNNIRTVIETHAPLSMEYLLPIQGTHLFFEARLIPRAVNQVIAIIRNVTDRKQAEMAIQKQVERETLLRTITQRIRQSLNLEEILDVAVNEVRQTLRGDRVLILHLRTPTSAIVLQESVLPNYPRLIDLYPADECLPAECQQLYLSGNPRIITAETMKQMNPCLVDFVKAMQVQSKMAAPILLNADNRPAQLWGILIVHSCSYPRQWQQDEADLLQQIANQLAIAIQQAELYTQLQTELHERATAEAQLRTSLQEKDVLLKEVHHRVKNNMQMVSSLLRLQSAAITDPAVLKLFNDSQQRVKAMALIHERLYRSDNLAQINVANYLRDLAEDLLQSYNTTAHNIHLNLALADLELNLDIAIPCGLIVNELIVNALKYAFPGQGYDEIKLQFWLDENYFYHLIVKDNGIGITDPIDFQNVESLGLQLVYGLAQQLGGTINLTQQAGTQFEITFRRST